VDLAITTGTQLAGYSRITSRRILLMQKTNHVFIDEPAGTNPNIARTGRSLNSQFGYQAIGLFQDTIEIANAPKQNSLGGAPKPGDIRYADISGPDGKPDGVIDANDRTYIGRSNIPEIIYGIGWWRWI
jgi:hypothetical protein